MKPPSIVRFEQLYLAGLALGLVATAVSWRGNSARLADNPATASIASWYLPVSTGVSILITLLLWYFIARRASVVAKWIAVVFVALGVIGGLFTLFALVGGRSPNVAASILALVVTAVQVGAVAMLFRPDARLWFGQLPDSEEHHSTQIRDGGVITAEPRVLDAEFTEVSHQKSRLLSDRQEPLV